jgi:hypothetical protein
MKTRLTLVVMVVLACCTAYAAETVSDVKERVVVARTWNLCDYKTDLDGQWECTIVASDGNCYFGSSSHSARTGASFFKFDPLKQELALLCKDITQVCGEDVTVNAPQGKLHSPIVEIHGWLYFGTHASYFGKPYKGSHLIGYELATQKFRDFGVIHEGYTNYAGVAGWPGDAQGKGRCVYIYVLAPGQNNDKPCYLYRVDIETGQKKSVGTLPAGGFDAAVYYMFADRKGNCWLPAPEGTLVKYDREQDKLVQFPGALPGKSARRFNDWHWCQAIPGQNKALVSAASDKKVYIFDPEAKDGKRFTFVADVAGAGLASCLAGSTLYYAAGGDGRVRLYSLDISAEKPQQVDLGRITDKDGRKPMRLPALSADTQGRIYITGDWYTLPGDTATTRLQDRGGKEAYQTQNRCERFAFIQLPSAQK